ncbi:aspartate aminotransferase family protein [Paraburkholderia bannensis]|uniref:aspartate aminotransferase family protein n=1 Tax=Paraburkholderia bannensis TaxID=765414 RepID=UPI002AB634C1|nr:aminotransferase class III-fold pyridoxal phosphate-dependent enzyme [Paraburkholderia bannensis]
MTYLVGDVSSSARCFPLMDGKPVAIARSSGPYVWDEAGKRYIDTVLGFGGTILGHAPAAVTEAAAAALISNPLPAVNHPSEEAAAAALAQRAGKLTKVIFTNSGSEAVHLALRVARVATGKRRIVKIAAGFDGWLDGVVFGNVGTAEARFKAGQRPANDFTTVIRYNDFDDVTQVFAEFNDIAAIVVEPMLANAACIPAAEGYLAHLQATAHKNGALLICDEVLMGFRLHGGLTSHMYGIDPDLVSVGKAIGSGIAVSAVLGKPEYMKVAEEGRALRGGTFSGNPVACAAVLATMPALDSADYHALRTRGDSLRASIVESFKRNGRTVSTSGYGNVFSIWFSEQPPKTYDEGLALVNAELSLALHMHLRREGILIMPSPYGRMYLSFAHDQSVVDEMKAIFERVAAQMADIPVAAGA